MAVWRSSTAQAVTPLLLLPMLLLFLPFLTLLVYAKSIKSPVKMEVFTEADLARAIARSNADKGLVFQHILDGIVQGYCSITATDCTFTNNRADKIGGAVFNTGEAEQPWWSSTPLTILIRYCTFTSNVTSAVETYGGGAIFVAYTSGKSWTATVDIAFSSFLDNRAENGSGGAIGSEEKWRLVLHRVNFIRNTASRSGGAIWTYGTVALSSINCTFTENSAGSDSRAWGGAVAVEGLYSNSDLIFCRTSFIDNRSPADNGQSANVLLEYDADTRLAFCPRVPKSGVRGVTSNGDYEFDVDKATKDCKGCTGCINDCNGHGKCFKDKNFVSTCRCNKGYDPEEHCSKCLPYGKTSKNCKF